MNSRATEHAAPATPSLAELMAGYLSKAEVSATDAGTGQVEAYDTGLSHPVDAALAWRGGLASLAGLGGESASLQRPTEWLTLVQSRESNPTVVMAAGNYPQMLRDLPGLVQAENLADLRSGRARTFELPGLADWANRTAKVSFAGRLLAAGVLRLAGHFEAASETLGRESGLPAGQLQAWQNERAALHWSRGECDQAVELWRRISDSPVGQFNLGMATLFDKPAESVAFLQAAIKQLAEDDPWRHLAGIYLALAEMRI
ncbi:hypothetical protein BH10PLA2_BH10PLA2_39470 [soil metagenome]